MARDRKRAKQRRERRRPGARTGVAGHARARRIPGCARPASADADEFDAALVRGAGGEPADAESAAARRRRPGTPQSETLSAAEIEAEGDVTRATASGSSRSPARRRTPERAGAPIARGGNRAIGFMRASWAELQRVQWPDRPQVFQATAVVLGFVAIAGAYLGFADFVAKEIVESRSSEES